MSEFSALEAAKNVLLRAVEMDKMQRYLEAKMLYLEGIHLLIQHMTGLEKSSTEKEYYRSKIEGYIKHAESLKAKIEREKKSGNFHQHISIKNDSIGNGYSTIFAGIIDQNVHSVTVNDAYIRKPYQILNFLRFCEMLVLKADRLQSITLLTTREGEEQLPAFDCLRKSLLSRNITLTVTYSDSLHDREIRFSNGWIVKIGRGLDYFKPLSKYSIGSCDMNLRPCNETTIDIYFDKSAT